MRIIFIYHRFNNLFEPLNGYLAVKVGQGILSCDLMDGKYNCSNPPKVNGKCFYKGKFRKKCLIYEVKCTRCDAIYIGKMQQTFKETMDGHFSYVQHILKNG